MVLRFTNVHASAPGALTVVELRESTRSSLSLVNRGQTLSGDQNSMLEETKTRKKSTDTLQRTRGPGKSVQHVDAFRPTTKVPRPNADGRLSITPSKSPKGTGDFWPYNRMHQGISKGHSHAYVRKEKLGGNMRTSRARNLLDMQAHISLRHLLQSASNAVHLGISMLNKHCVAPSHGISYASSLSEIGLAELDQLQTAFDRLALSLHQTYQLLLGHRIITLAEKIRIARGEALIGQSHVAFALYTRRDSLTSLRESRKIALVETLCDLFGRIQEIVDKVAANFDIEVERAGRAAKKPLAAPYTRQETRNKTCSSNETAAKNGQFQYVNDQGVEVAPSSGSAQRSHHISSGPSWPDLTNLNHLTLHKASQDGAGVSVSSSPLQAVGHDQNRTGLSSLHTSTLVNQKALSPKGQRPFSEELKHTKQATTLEKRFAALREAAAKAAVVPNKNSVGLMLADPSPLLVMNKSTISITANLARIETERLSAFDSGPNVSLNEPKSPALTVDVSPRALPPTVLKSEYKFSVLDAEGAPLAGLTWVTAASKALPKLDEGSKGYLRMHVARKLNTDPRSLGLRYHMGEAGKLNVNIVLDPYIRIESSGQVHVLDYSASGINKVCIRVGELRKQVEDRLEIKDHHGVHLFFDHNDLKDNDVTLKDTGFLSSSICQGWEPLFIRATVELNEKECIVCGNILPVDWFPHHITAGCDHSANSCRDCLRKWIETAIDSNGWDRLRCLECEKLFQHMDVKAYASSQGFERYDNLVTRAFLSTTPNFRWCLSPSCKAGHIHESASNPIFQCNECGAKHCVRHSLPWHIGETCEQYDYRTSGQKSRDEEKASAEKIKQTTKDCPQCECHIEKNDGCDHMTCRKCRYDFCWICLADYDGIRKQGNRMHRVTCAHYRP